MKTHHAAIAAIALAMLTVMAACARVPETSNDSASAPTEPPRPASSTIAGNGAMQPPQRAGAEPPLMVVHKSASCGCCGAWVEHMRAAGFQVDVRESDDLNPVKQRVGVPLGKGSCHTAEVGGYFVEGHVPAEDIKRLLAQQPDAKGLVVPGMPAGSPGMEMPDGTSQSYTVELVGRDGSATAYARH